MTESKSELLPCPHCEGSGHGIAATDCWACDGTGEETTSRPPAPQQSTSCTTCAAIEVPLLDLAAAIGLKCELTYEGIIREALVRFKAQAQPQPSAGGGDVERVRDTLLCAHCEIEPATCLGSYEQLPYSLACDVCCGHGSEDGHCLPVEDAIPLISARLESRSEDLDKAEATLSRIEALVKDPEFWFIAEGEEVWEAIERRKRSLLAELEEQPND